MARIAFIEVTATVSYGGVQTAVWKLAEALETLGHEVTIFGGRPHAPPVVPRRVRVQTFPFTARDRVPDLGSRFRRSVERLSFAWHARAAVVAGAFDWAIINKPFDLFWPWILPAGSRTRFAFMSGGTDFIPGDRALARRVRAWFAASHFNAWQIRAHYKCWPTVIYNGVDVEEFSPRRAEPELRAQLGVPPEAALFAFAGRLVGWKGMALALRALADPALRELDVRLLVIGDGPERAPLEKLARALGLGPRVLLHPPVAHGELPRYYAAADIGIFPSIGDEAFGITIAEAMACGKPVIATYIGGIPEVVGNEGTCGLLVEPGSVGALAAAMRELALDRPRRLAMGAAARARIARQFAWQMAARRLLAGLAP